MFGFSVLWAAASMLVMAGYVRRSDRKAVWVAFLWFAASDAVHSLILYVPNAVGA